MAESVQVKITWPDYIVNMCLEAQCTVKSDIEYLHSVG